MGGLGRLILLLLAHLTLSQAFRREYKYYSTVKTWNNAQSYCRQHHLDLAVITTQAEWTRVLSMVQSYGQSHVWLGPTLTLTDDCVTSHGTSPAHTWGCTNLHPFICLTTDQIIFHRQYKIVMKANGTMDMNDPNIQEALRAQTKNAMKDQGIQQLLNLKWKKQPNGV